MTHLNSSKNISSIILIFVRLQNASVLSKAFSGILLNSYFNVKSVPIVYTLEDLYHKKRLSIASVAGSFTRMSRFSEYPDHFLEESETRSQEYGNKAKLNTNLLSPKVFMEMTKGKTIILVDSLKSRTFSEQFRKFSDIFKVSEQKYSSQYSCFIVLKNENHSDLIKFM